MPWALLIFLTIVNILNYFDRYIVQAVEPYLKSEFQVSNTESAILGGAFVLGYFIFSPLFGFLGDRKDRRVLMGVGLLAWSLSTALTGFSTGLISFVLARSLVGIGEASFGAIVPGYLKGRVSDPLALNNALSIFYVAIPVGAALGFIAGGEIAGVWGWRSVFLLAAIPGVLLTTGFLRLAPEQRMERVAEASSFGFWEGVGRIFRSRDLTLVILGYILNTFALNGIAMFIVRHGMSLGLEESLVSSTFGIILAVTGFVGALGGGIMASKFAATVHNDNKVRGLLIFVSVTTLLGAPFLGAAFIAKSPLWFFASCFVAQIALFAGVAPLNSVLVERAPAGLQTLTQGVTIFMIQLFGSLMGPIVIGKVADRLQSMALVTSEQAALALALQVATLAMVLSGILWFGASRRTE